MNRKPEVDLRDVDGDTPLMLAAYYGFVGGTSILLNRGADPALSNSFGRSVLSAACQGGKVKVVDLLVTVLPKGAVNGEAPMAAAHTAFFMT